MGSSMGRRSKAWGSVFIWPSNRLRKTIVARWKSDGPRVWNKPGLSGYLVSLVGLVCLVCLVKSDRPDQRDGPERPLNRQHPMCMVRTSLVPAWACSDTLHRQPGHCSRTPHVPFSVRQIFPKLSMFLRKYSGMRVRCQGLLFAVPRCESHWMVCAVPCNGWGVHDASRSSFCCGRSNSDRSASHRATSAGGFSPHSARLVIERK